MAQQSEAPSIIWHATTSLDGYIAAPDHDVSWVFDFFDSEDPLARSVQERTGTVVAGRNSYEAGIRDGREVFGGGWHGAQYLLTDREFEGEPPSGVEIRYGEIWPILTEALAQSGGKDLLIIGADVARQALEAHLVDEVIVHIAPILLGSGTKFFDAATHHLLNLAEVHSQDGVITARYVVPRSEGHSLVHGRDTP